MEHASVEKTRRLAAATEARKFVDLAHYLWGKCGYVPKRPAELWPAVPALEQKLDLPKPPAEAVPMMLAAKGVVRVKTGTVLIACGGRYGTTKAPYPITNRLLCKKENLKVADFTDKELAELKKNQHSKVRWPRHLIVTNDKRVRWGESCLNVPHFDCSGFVDWCLSKAIGHTIRCYSVGNWRAELKTFGALPVEAHHAQAGDLIFRKGHMGLIAEPGVVVHASDPARGVVEEHLDSSKWLGGCFSLPTNFWVPEMKEPASAHLLQLPVADEHLASWDEEVAALQREWA